MKLSLKHIISGVWLCCACLSPLRGGLQAQTAPDQFSHWRNVGLEAEDLNLLDSARNCYLKAELITQNSKQKSDEATILNDLAIVSRKQSNYVACKNYHLKAKEIAIKTDDFEMLEMCMHGLGTLYELTGDYDEAVACYLKAIQLTTDRGDVEGNIITRQNLAKTYMHLRFKDAAMKEVEAALHSAQSLKNDSLSANVLHDYAEILIEFKEYGLALSKMETALNTYQKIGYDRYIGSSLVYLGDIYAKINQNEHAFAKFEKALIYSEKTDLDVLADLYLKLGDHYNHKSDVATAQFYFTKSYEISKANAFKSIEQLASWRLYQLHAKQKNTDSALSFLEESYLLKDDLYNAEKIGRVSELQLQYDNEKQLKSLHAMQIRQDKYLLGSCILLFLSIIGGLAFNSRQKSKNNILLASKNDEIADQNRQLADHIGVLKQYSYAAAHDLKEPLRTITSFINLLERKYIKTIDEPEAQEYMQFISSSAQRMNLLLTDLLEYNSILSQEVGFEAINTQDVLNDVWSGLSALVEDKQAVLQITNKLPKLKMNRFHMTQLMQNLVSNGIKFTERNHSLIQVGFERKENTYILSFSDNGIGINEQYQEKIFQMFYRLNDLKGAEGSGIGLTIVKNIIEKYKGRIWFNSEVGKGTTFFISLPIAMIIEDEQAATTQKAIATLVQV